MSWLVFLKIMKLRSGDTVVIPNIYDCVDLKTPSYVDEERILRFLNEKFSKLVIRGIIYITKETFCYVVENEGLIDFPITLLQRIRIDGVYSFTKSASQWAVE